MYLEIVEYFLLFLLFLSCSTPYRIDTGSISIGLAEIAAWIYILWRWITGSDSGTKPEPSVRWLMRGIGILAIWSAFLWMLSENWDVRKGMFLDWILAGLVFWCLLRSPIQDWKRIALLFMAAALPNVILGGLQHGMGIGLSPKDFSGWGKNAASFPIYGFFGHSNDLAVYLYWPFLVCVGFVFSTRAWFRASFFVVAILYGAVLYWTLSRSTLITLGLVGVVLALVFLLPRKKTFLFVLAAGIGLTALSLTAILLRQPIEWIDQSTSGRLGLWSQTLQVISQDPLYLPMGYLAASPIGAKVFWIPHNIYLLSWVEYGWPGVLLLTGLAWFFLWNGWKRYERLRIHSAGAVLWIGFAGLFLVNGMFILYFHEPYVILNFICLTAIWIAQIRDIDRSSEPSSKPLSAHEEEQKAGRVASPTSDSSRV